MLLERNTQLETLHALAADVNRSGALVLIAGEAGSGKTTLVRSFVESLGSSTLVIIGACDPLTTPRPLGPVYDFAADADSGLSDVLDEGKGSMEVFHEILSRLKSTIRPIVMVIEDIHWADEATLDLLRFIGRRIGDTKAIVICTYRDDEVGADHPLRPVLGQLIGLPNTTTIAVPLLTIEAVTKLAAESGLDAGRLFRLTDGNPFFVTEVLASGEGLPASVSEAVIARAGVLDARSRLVVEGVSIAPRSLSIEHAAALVGGRIEDIDEALGAGVLIGDGTSLRFRHELARTAVEASLPPARRLSLHRRMLDLLAEEENPDIARLAHHAIAADEVDLILEYAPEAARAAVRRGARKEAIALYLGALAHADAMDEETEGGLRTELGLQFGVTERFPEAAEQHALATELYRRVGDPAKLGRSLVTRARAMWRINSAADDSESEAFQILEPLGASIELAEAYYTRAYRLMLARQGGQARAAIDRARELAETSAASQALKWDIKMIDGTIAIVLGEGRRGIELLEESIVEAERAGDVRRLNTALGMLGSGGGEIRSYEIAVPALERGIEHGLATDEDYLVSYNRSWLARIAFEQGRWDDAVDLASLVDRTSIDRTGISIITALSAQGRVKVRRGEAGGAQLLQEMVELGEDHELQHVWNAICGFAEHHWLRGQPEHALPVLEPAYERALGTTSEWARGEIGFWMWRTGAIPRPPAGAARPFSLQMRGRWEEAANEWAMIGCPYERAMALSDGDNAAKIEAVAVVDQLGARPLADRIRSELRATGAGDIPMAPRTSATSNTLSERQLEVLRLMEEGLTNSEIADRLYISKKTVEHHASAIYTKLGVSSRAKAVAALRSGLGG